MRPFYSQIPLGAQYIMTANHPRHSQRSSAAVTSSSNVVGVHYRVGRKIGEGSFGIIYEGDFLQKRRKLTVTLRKLTHFKKKGTNLLNNQQVAIKFEPRKSDAPQLRDEYRTYKILSGLCMLHYRGGSTVGPCTDFLCFQ